MRILRPTEGTCSRSHSKGSGKTQSTERHPSLGTDVTWEFGPLYGHTPVDKESLNRLASLGRQPCGPVLSYSPALPQEVLTISSRSYADAPSSKGLPSSLHPPCSPTIWDNLGTTCLHLAWPSFVSHRITDPGLSPPAVGCSPGHDHHTWSPRFLGWSEGSHSGSMVE